MITRAKLNIAIDSGCTKCPKDCPECPKDCPDCPKYCPECPKAKAADCADLLNLGHNKSGIYVIWPVNRLRDGRNLTVYCDMDTVGGGWTVIQRRGDFGSPDDFFYQDWEGYKEGFGSKEKDFWLGNDNIFALTNQKRYSVRFELTDFYKNTRYALYDTFFIDAESNNYTVHVSGYSGDAGNAMETMQWNNQAFTTKVREYVPGNCASTRKGGWWYHECSTIGPNGLYRKEKERHTSEEGVFWDVTGESLMRTEIKIRPENFRASKV